MSVGPVEIRILGTILLAPLFTLMAEKARHGISFPAPSSEIQA